MTAPIPERAAPPRRFLERAAPVVILTVLAGVILAFCGNQGGSRLDAGEDLSGGTSTTRPSDEPFALAEANDRGQTTLPPSFFEDGATTTAPTTTTTATTIPLPPLDAPDDPVCQGALILGEMFRMGEIRGDFPRVQAIAVEKLRAASQQFAAAGGVYTAGATLLADRADAVAKATREEEIGPLVRSIRLLDDPALVPLLGELRAHLAQVCPQLVPN